MTNVNVGGGSGTVSRQKNGPEPPPFPFHNGGSSYSNLETIVSFSLRAKGGFRRENVGTANAVSLNWDDPGTLYAPDLINGVTAGV